MQAWRALCLFCRVSVRTFHLSWLLMASVHASALIRVLWTCHLIAEEAEQVITFESLIAQTKKRKNGKDTVQGGGHGQRSHVARSWVLGTTLSHWVGFLSRIIYIILLKWKIYSVTNLFCTLINPVVESNKVLLLKHLKLSISILWYLPLLQRKKNWPPVAHTST